MISIITSYHVDSANDLNREPLGELKKACDELSIYHFQCIDVLVRSSDIKAVKRNGITCINDIASHLAMKIKEYTSCQGVYLQVAALATNFPNISNCVDPILWDDAKDDLAVCLLVADKLGIRVVEIVCGSRIVVQKPSPQDTKIRLSPVDEVSTVKHVQQCFAQGILQAYQRAQAASTGNRFPHVAIALEMEPDILSLVRNISEAESLLVIMDDTLDAENTSVLKDRVGINLDMGHVLVASDRYGSGNKDDFLREFFDVLERNRNRIFHAHIGDHSWGAHWCDAPTGKFRLLNNYEHLLQFYYTLTQKPLSRYFTGVLAIEIEACNNIVEVANARDSIIHYCKNIGITFTNGDSDIENLEFKLESLPDNQIMKGYMEGINLTIFRSLRDLLANGEEVPGSGTSLFTSKDLALIRKFLSVRGPDDRIRIAMEIAAGILERLKLRVLASWIERLNILEHERVFHRDYRDHTVHSIYVYLLGLMFYAESEAFRRIVQSNNPNPRVPHSADWFARCWAVTALAHDVGYCFESDNTSVQDDALAELNKYGKDFVAEVVAFDKFNNKINRKFVDNLLINFGATAIREISNVKDVPCNNFFINVGVAASKGSNLKANDLNTIYKALHEVKFDGAVASNAKRSNYYDHGIMSAGILYYLTDAHSHWLNLLAKNLPQITPNPQLPQMVIDSAKNWVAECRGNGVLSDDDIIQCCAAVALHNLEPEKSAFHPGGYLYKEETVTAKGLEGITILTICIDQPLAFLLNMCDALQEWDRYTFVSSLLTTKRSISASQIRVKKNPSDDVIHFNYHLEEPSNMNKDQVLTCKFDDAWRLFLSFDEFLPRV